VGKFHQLEVIPTCRLSNFLTGGNYRKRPGPKLAILGPVRVGFRAFGFRASEGLGFRVFGFRASEGRGLGFRVYC
jgi:hypothetical protein